MQFPPNIETDDQLRVYDSRNLKLATFTHESSEKIGSSDLRVDKYKGLDYGDDISFGFNLPLYQKAQGCYGCNLNSEEQRTIYIDDVEWVQATSPSDNYMMV